MSATKVAFAPLIRGVARRAGGFRFFDRKTNPPLACGSRPPSQGVWGSEDSQ
jgi:hypothetical protein